MTELKKIDTVVGNGQEAVAGNHVDVCLLHRLAL